MFVAGLAAAQPPELSPATAPSAIGELVALRPAEAAEAAAALGAGAAVEVADGLELSAWAPPGLVANPLTLDLDSAGRAYVVSSARAGLLLDIRQHPDWVPEVHSLQTTEDLRQFFRRVMAPERSDANEWLPDYNEDGSRDYRDLTVVAERVFRVEDTDGDGVADRSQVVHEGFNDDIASDIAGGILVDGEDLYVTAAPDLWRLRDSTGDGLFDEKTSLSHGYSVHPAFSGHDMSALAIGPDGRLYWKIGDIGLNVVDETGRRWAYPNQGAVLRSELDGSNFEVFARGLRNTQEIAFDQYGNLVSVDNDGDHPGETERIVYLVLGSDAGWRSTWQYGKYSDDRNNDYNVWMEEDLYRPHFEGQAAYITPPIAPHRAGPSGFAYNPGTALSAEWRDAFFVTSFTGGAANASVHAFRLKPSGAGFELAEDTRIVGGLLSSGIAFGPDGALYLTDWIRGWGATGEGQLWRLDVPGSADDPLRREVARLLDTPFETLDRNELDSLLAHPDLRIRQKAQFALVDRNERRLLDRKAADGDDRLARIHAIWGLGQLVRFGRSGTATLRPLLEDTDPEIRAQAARVLGDIRDGDATAALIAALIAALEDPAARVRFFAAEALGRIGAAAAVLPIARMLAANDNDDVYLRTAGIHALAGIGDTAALTALASHASPAVRIAAVVALRRLGDPGTAAFVDDSDHLVVTEAARAINDEGGIVPALPALAAALDGPVSEEAFVRRAISANLRVGTDAAARRLGALAAAESEDPAMRVEAVAALGVWPAPSTLDRVDGAWLGQLAPRDASAARLVAEDLLPLLRADTSSEGLKIAILETATALAAPATGEHALARLEADASPAVRRAALRALAALAAPDSGPSERGIEAALSDPDESVRRAAIALVPTMPVAPAVAAGELGRVIRSDALTTAERQSAIAALASVDAPEATALLALLLDELARDGIDAALELDLLQAAAVDGSEELLARLARLGVGRGLETIAAARPGALAVGGSADNGRQIVLRHPAAQCVRCHTLDESESTVGPPLDGIGSRLDRAALVESLVDPGASIAAGFGAGETAVSAMPPMSALLQPHEIRDVVEFLATNP